MRLKAYQICIIGRNKNSDRAHNRFKICKLDSTPWLQFIGEMNATDDGKLFALADNNAIMYDKVADTWTVWNMSNGLSGPPTSLGSRGNTLYVGHYQGIDVFENGAWSNIDLTHRA